MGLWGFEDNNREACLARGLRLGLALSIATMLTTHGYKSVNAWLFSFGMLVGLVTVVTWFGSVKSARMEDERDG